MSVQSFSDHLNERASDCSIFERALDALPDGVLLVNSDRRIVYTNAAFKRLWKMPDDVLATRDDGHNLQFAMNQLVDPEGFLREVERLHATNAAIEDEVVFRDGRIISRRSLPFQVDGNFRARIWIFTDVTEARKASIDHLTQLPNRLAFARDFPPFVTAASDGLLRSAAIVDVDHFKRYNDQYGHGAGDEVLQRIGGILKSHVRRAGDLAFRIGGEEFFMATRTRRANEARAFFDSVRAQVAGLNAAHDGNTPHGVVTVSIGYGSFASHREPDAVFQIVDKALYRAKAAGRNRIVEATI